jgi:hypothetical protein
LDQLEEKLATARERFAKMLLVWRKRHGWTGRTWEEWHAAAPDYLPMAVVNSVITGLEKNRNSRTVPQTFVALGLANTKLDKEDRGPIADRVLRDRVYAAEPIRHADGTPWNGADFFAAYTGFIDIPPGLVLPEPVTPATSQELRERFMQQRGSQTPRHALDTLLGLQPRLGKTERERIEEVLFGFADFSDDESELARTVDRLLAQWAGHS